MAETEQSIDDARNVRLLCLDVDGVMTDGRIVLDDRGGESKRFHVRDGTGIRLWLRMGLEIAIITGRSGMVVRHRADELGITHVIQGSKDKAADYGRLLGELGVAASQSSMLGDDLTDLPVMRLAGYPMAVADAVTEVREAAAFTTVLPGGHGAVREAIEHLLRAQDRWNDALSLYD